jgi:hypothetical protein
MSQLLEERLRTLDIRTPPEIVSRALTAATSPPQYEPAPSSRRTGRYARRLGYAAAGIAAFLIANVAVASFVPAYSQAIANAPVVGPVSSQALTYLGLQPSAIAARDQTVTASGHTLRLVGVYADTLRTVVLVQVDGRPFEEPSKTTKTYGIDGYLTDQFGHRYSQTFTPGPGAAFEPITGPAVDAGARLTLHVKGLMPTFKADRVSGNWEMTFTVTRQPAGNVSLPAPVHIGDTTYIFTSVRISGDLVEVRWLATGGSVDQMHRLMDGYYGKNPAPPPSVQEQIRGLNQAYFWPQITDEAGNRVRSIQFGATYPKGKPVEGMYQGVVSGPGRYIFTFGSAATSDATRVIEVK